MSFGKKFRDKDFKRLVKDRNSLIVLLVKRNFHKSWKEKAYLIVLIVRIFSFLQLLIYEKTVID